MEQLLQRVGEEVLPRVMNFSVYRFTLLLDVENPLNVIHLSFLQVDIVCGGSYRRRKATCGDLDIVITHPDGQRYVQSCFLLSCVFFSKTFLHLLKLVFAFIVLAPGLVTRDS